MQKQQKKWVQPKKCIGPSKLASILNMTPIWCTPAQLKQQLENGYWDHNNHRIDFGNRKEAVGIEFYKRNRKVDVKQAYFANALNRRIIGKADGLIGDDGGVEIKCHKDRDVLESIPPYYMVQVVAYMYLYKRAWWDFVSCSFKDDKLKKCRIFRVYWKNHRDTWQREWLPEIKKFINRVNWKK